AVIAPYWEDYASTYYIGVLLAFGIYSACGAVLVLTGKEEFEKGFLKNSALFFIGVMIALALSGQALAGAETHPIVAMGGSFLALILCSIGALKMRDRMGQTVVWTFGTLFIFIFSLATLSSLRSGEPMPSIFILALGVLLVATGFSLYVYGKWQHMLLSTEMRSGDRMYLKKEYASALDVYEEAQRKSPEGNYDEAAWLSKGSALINLGRYEEGIVALDAALHINPQSEVAWNNKGNALSKLGNQTGALKCYKEAVKMNNSYEIAWNNMGNVYARRGVYDKAIRCYDRALSLQPRYKDALINKGYVLVRQGRYEEAIACADRITVPSPM
ncbi:MAG: tetratricopeptide repeat protein, partial [Thermoplasmata archaeon]|nr:tetratricopeptide repeat protein [Thermoplasmata archaeon]